MKQGNYYISKNMKILYQQKKIKLLMQKIFSSSIYFQSSMRGLNSSLEVPLYLEAVTRR